MPSSPRAQTHVLLLCRYFGRLSHRDRMELVNDRGAVWSPQLMVRQEVAQVRPPATMYSSVPTHRARTSPQMDNPAGRIIMRYRVDKVKELVRCLAPACTQLTRCHATLTRRRGAPQVLEPTVPANNSTPMDAGEAGQVPSRALPSRASRPRTLPARFPLTLPAHVRMCMLHAHVHMYVNVHLHTRRCTTWRRRTSPRWAT